MNRTVFVTRLKMRLHVKIARSLSNLKHMSDTRCLRHFFCLSLYIRGFCQWNKLTFHSFLFRSRWMKQKSCHGIFWSIFFLYSIDCFEFGQRKWCVDRESQQDKVKVFVIHFVVNNLLFSTYNKTRFQLTICLVCFEIEAIVCFKVSMTSKKI